MDENFDYDSGEEIAEDHVRLVDAVSRLDKTQHIHKPSRSEPTLQSSEFHLVKSENAGGSAASYTDLVKVLGKTAKNAEIGRNLRTTQKKTKTLPKPLEKPQAERIQRAVGFENVKKELGKWDAVVTANRVAPHRSFPLIQADISMKPSSAFLSKFRIKTELEKELEALNPPTEADEDNKQEFPLTLEEIIERRKEAAKLRAQQSYREAKARRQNKIKSKKFHRIERRNKMKKKLKDLEILQKTDPEAALKELEELEKIRAGERASLRHHSTGKWAQNLQIRAKHDTESRAELAQQLSIHRDLTQKMKALDSSDSEGGEEEVEEMPKHRDMQNPWTQEKNEIDDFISRYRKFWSNEQKKSEESINKVDLPHGQSSDQITMPNRNNVPKESDTSLSKSTKALNAEKATPKNMKRGSMKTTPSKSMNDTIEMDLNISKSSKKRKSVCTSSWIVTDINKKLVNGTEQDSIDTLFDNMEDDIQSEIVKKLNNLRNKFDKQHINNTTKHDSDSDQEYVPDLSFKVNKKRPVIDMELDETTGTNHSAGTIDFNHLKKQSDSVNTNKVSTIDAESIDPNKFINLKPKRLLNQAPDMEISDEMLDDDQEKENRQAIVAEAFEEDDIVSDFQKEKQDAIDKEKPQDIDLTLPGWGTWGGKDIKNTRKRKRFTVKCPKKIPRKDENRADLIINENINTKLKTHMVSDLPFPFTSVSDFEASIRAPVINTFIPVNASKKLTKPAVTTKLGAIIDPMDENTLVQKKKSRR